MTPQGWQVYGYAKSIIMHEPGVTLEDLRREILDCERAATIEGLREAIRIAQAEYCPAGRYPGSHMSAICDAIRAHIAELEKR